jgi:hypothetical protein
MAALPSVSQTFSNAQKYPKRLTEARDNVPPNVVWSNITLLAVWGMSATNDTCCVYALYYAAMSGGSVPTFRDTIGFIFRGQEGLFDP